MEWKKDDELFADIDENGKLFSDEFTRTLIRKKASDVITNKTTIQYSEYTSFQEKGGEIAASFRGKVDQIKDFVKKYNCIGEFPSPIMTIVIEQWRDKTVRSANPNYNRALAESLQEIDSIEDNARSEIWMQEAQLDYRASNALELNLWMENELGKVYKSADTARDILKERAMASDAGTDIDPYTYRTVRIKQSQKESSYLFFGEVRYWWDGSTDTTSVADVKGGKIILVLLYLLRCLAWMGILGGALLMGNMIWQIENPVSAFFLGHFSALHVLTGAMVAATLLLVLVIATHNGGMPMFDLEIPVATFVYPILFGTFISAGSLFPNAEGVMTGIQTTQAEDDTLTMIMWVTVILFLIVLIYKSGFFSYMGDAIKVIATMFIVTGFSSVMIHKAFENPEYHRYVMYGILGLLALCLLVNLGYVLACALTRLDKDGWIKELLKAVNENALTEYKMLRFVWLWIFNSDIPEKEVYLAAVEKEEEKLKEKVRMAEEYAKEHKLEFHLKDAAIGAK